MLTYRVFTDGETVLNALKKVFYESQPARGPTGESTIGERLNIPGGNDGNLTPRRTSGASSVSGKSPVANNNSSISHSGKVNQRSLFYVFLGYCSEGADRDRSLSGESTALRYRQSVSMGRLRNLSQSSYDDNLGWVTESIDQPTENGQHDVKSPPVITTIANIEISVHKESPSTPPPETRSFLQTSVSTTIITTSCSADTLSGEANTLNLLSGPSSPSNISSVTLVGSTGSGSTQNVDEKAGPDGQRLFKYSQAPSSPLLERKRKSTSDTPNDDMNKENNGNGITKDKPSTSKTESNANIDIQPDTMDSFSSKPTIVSAITKSGIKEYEKPQIQSKFSSNVLQPNISYLSTNRRPSTGTIGVPMAALTLHRHSLQYNSSESGFGIEKVVKFTLQSVLDMI